MATSTDLTPKHTYIDPHLPYIDPYTTSMFIPYLVPCILVGSYYNTNLILIKLENEGPKLDELAPYIIISII